MKNPRTNNFQSMISNIVEKVEKVLGEKSLVKLGDETIADVKEWLSTGSYALDKVIGGGFPVGRILEIYGPEGSGKTTLGYTALAETQRKGGLALMIDTETSYDSVRAKAIGLNTDNLLYAQINTVEEVFKLIEIVIKELREQGDNRLLTIMWDSVASTSIKAEIEGELGDSFYGTHAKRISEGFRKFKRELTWNRVTFICINQIRQNVGVMFGPKWRTFGGEAIKFYASVRLRISSVKQITKDKLVTGIEVKVKTVKNKVFPPYRECKLIIDFEKGIDNIASSIIYLVDNEIIQSKVGWLTYKDNKYREPDLARYFIDHLDELKELVGEGKLNE